MAIKQRLIQAYKQAPWRTATQNGTLVMIGVFLLGCMIWINLTISVKTSEAGLNIQELAYEQRTLTRDIASKQSQIAEATASERMAKLATEMGFRPATTKDMTYITVSGYRGRQAQIAAPAQREVLPPNLINPSYKLSLSDLIADSIAQLVKKPQEKLP